jgi:hypothetical protein
MGRGVYMAATLRKTASWLYHRVENFAVPIDPPVSLVNKLSLRLFNEAYWRKHPSRRTTRLGHFEPFFYPLDGILHWNRIYGRKGFQQYQCVLPPDAAEAGTRALLKAIAESGEGSFLAVLKQFGDLQIAGAPVISSALGLLWHLIFLILHSWIEGLFRRLDDIVREARGRIFPPRMRI